VVRAQSSTFKKTPPGISLYRERLTSTLDVQGSSLIGAQLDGAIDVSGGAQPGRYGLHVVIGDVGNQLIIVQWAMEQAA